MQGFVPWPEEFVRLYKEKGYWEDVTLGEHFDRWVNQYSDRTALAYDGKDVTYRQLDEYVTKLAYKMVCMGIKTYDRVIFQLMNGPEVIYLFYACMKIGAIPICSLPLHRWTEISFFAEKAGARVLAIPAGTEMGFDYEEFADQIRESYPSVEFVFTTNKPRDPNKISINDSIEENIDLSVAKKELAKYRPDPMEPAVFQLSGGTTGVPKIIPRTHNDYYYNAKCDADATDYDQNSRACLAPPFMHNSALILTILPAHLKGGAVVISSPSVKTVLKSVSENRADSICLVPALVIGLLDVPEEELRNYDLSSLKKMYWGGNPLPEELLLKFMKTFHCDTYQVYGMAEGLICWTRRSDPLEVKLFTQGKPVSEADEVRVVDEETGLEVLPGQRGECQVRGPYTLRGYYKAEEHNKKAFTPDGFYRTGDLIKKDEQGNITVLGRIKDCISRGSEKINAEEVEGYISKFPKVKNVAVVAMPDKVMGERICAFVVPVLGQTFTLEVLSDFLVNIQKIAKFKIPERLEFIDEIPLTKSAKYEKKSLRERINMILKSEGKFYLEQ